MNFRKFCEFLDRIENVSSRNEMTSILKELYLSLDIDEAQIASYLLDGRVAPKFVDSEFQMSEKLLLKVAERINNLTKRYKGDVNKLREKAGDIGLVFDDVCYNSENVKNEKSLIQVYEILWQIVNTRGQGSVENKIVQSYNLLSTLSGLEAKYIARIITGTLRLGASVKTLLDAFSFIMEEDKSVREKLDNVYGVTSDIGYVAKIVLKNKKSSDLDNVKSEPGIPILSRLVERAKSFEELSERMEGDGYYIQPKFDGLRLQIHKSENGFEDSYKERIWSRYLRNSELENNLFGSPEISKVRLFTRNLEDVTSMFPEIVESALKIKCKKCILDGEVIGWDTKTNHFKSYQDTMTRKRKYDVSKVSENIPVKAFVFDILFLDNDLIPLDTQKRIELLDGLIKGNVQDIVHAENIEINNVEELKINFDKWVSAGLEGLIAKKKIGGYTPGSRNFEWIKLKKSFMTELSDSVDVVILGYYLGSGKRTKFGIGALLCGVYNEELDRFESLTKLGTGVTDLMWGEILEKLKPDITTTKPKNVEVDKLLIPDVWVFPKIVCTIEADEITKNIQKDSEVLAGGLSLRFPRMIEFDREKDIYQTTTISELIQMYK